MNAPSRTITIPHVGRIEGHGGIVVRLAGDRVADVDMAVYEGSRFYETLLLGKRYDEVQGIITRICAICSATHTVAALSALEQALGVARSERVERLRGLLLLGSTIESHALHVFALALPDFLGYESVIAMAARLREEVTFALALKQLGNRIQELVGGRAVHPVNPLVGGFGRLPRHAELLALRAELVRALDPLDRTVDLVARLDVPDWPAQPALYLALRPHDAGYRFRGASICTSRGEEYAVEDYARVVRELTVAHSQAKHAALAAGPQGEEPYVVGAIARLALWGDRLTGRARAARERLFPRGVPQNILFNNWAQLVELVHCVERSIEHCDLLLGMPEAEREMVEYEVRAGRGVSAVEAPRGTLFHEYAIDGDGRVTAANVITPTAQNLASVERDLRLAAERLLGRAAPGEDDRLGARLEMVVRAYDPCISCSVHVVRVSE